MDMTGKRVMITGASRGIGAEAGRAFAAAGAQVALVSRSRAPIDALAAEIGEAAVSIPCNVASSEEMLAAVETAQTRMGGLDVLICNAGVIEPISHLFAADPGAWGHVIDINLKGVFHGMRAVLPAMRAAGGGTIITVSSGAAHGPIEAWSHYCASKAGAAMLTRCLDLEERGNGIRALGLSPGTVATQMQREIKASGINPVSKLDWSAHIPPEWPAQALIWMCTADADEFLGTDVSLRDEGIRARVGLT
jgi:NAD(P)-dependent dehydrogenase (short-subunit alcohol dehydrogenase family)